MGAADRTEYTTAQTRTYNAWTELNSKALALYAIILHVVQFLGFFFSQEKSRFFFRGFRNICFSIYRHRLSQAEAYHNIRLFFVCRNVDHHQDSRCLSSLFCISDSSINPAMQNDFWVEMNYIKHTSLSPSTGKASYGSKMSGVSTVSVFAVTVKSQFCSCFLIENRIFLHPKWRTAAGNGYEVWKITGSFFPPRLFPAMCCWQTSFRNLVQISVPCHSDVTNALAVGFIFCIFSKTAFFRTSS